MGSIKKWWPPKIPLWKLINGAEINPIGLSSKNLKPENVTCIIRCAMELGLRHYDCAYIDGNEYEIGCAIKLCKEVCREDLFITNKLWNRFHCPKMVEKAVCYSLQQMDMEYFDLYMMHYPMAFQQCADEKHPKINDAAFRESEIYAKVDWLRTWKAMEGLVGDDKIRAIGVCNFNYAQMKRLIENACVAPLMLQTELHPHLMERELMALCCINGIHVTASNAMGTTQSYTDPYILRNDLALPFICTKHCKSPGQVLIRYQLQSGNLCLFNTNKYERLADDLNVFDFHLDVQDMDVLDNINKWYRYHRFEPFTDHMDYPWKERGRDPLACACVKSGQKLAGCEENNEDSMNHVIKSLY